MKKCYKVVRRTRAGNLVSCILSQCSGDSRKLQKKYGTDFTTDHALVFSDRDRALRFKHTAFRYGYSIETKLEDFEVWEAKAAHLEECTGLSNLNFISLREFLKTGTPMISMSVPISTMFAFDVRLIRKIA